jgi:hypothetical protein
MTSNRVHAPPSRGNLGLGDRRYGKDFVPTIWLAFALSLLIHAAVLWQWLPQLHLLSPDLSKQSEAQGSLSVRLMPAPSAARAPKSPAPLSVPAPAAQPPATATRPQKAPPVIALKRPPPGIPAPPIAPNAVLPSPGPAPAAGDLAAYVEARRRARLPSTPEPAAQRPADAQSDESGDARSKLIIANNLGTQRVQTFGYDPRRGGGVFRIVRMGYDSAEFLFFGWNKDVRRNTQQLIEVRKGDNSDMRIAVVRKMIAMIREHTQEDFVWDSYRLNRSLNLSARPRDNAGLEEFMLREFFSDPDAPQ